jgi:hypothetical protein
MKVTKFYYKFLHKFANYSILNKYYKRKLFENKNTFKLF